MVEVDTNGKSCESAEIMGICHCREEHCNSVSEPNHSRISGLESVMNGFLVREREREKNLKNTLCPLPKYLR